jgi:hypothetical protein
MNLPLRDPVPMLWVIPPDLIRGNSSKILASCISRLENIHVWQLDGGAVAFSLPDILVNRGRPVDYDAFLRRTRPLFQIVDACAASKRDALNLEIPDNKYWVRVSLKPEETNKQSCVYFKSFLTDWNPFAFKACSSYALSDMDLESVREYLTNWLAAAGSRTILGERLQVGSTDLTLTRTPATVDAYPASGYEVRCSSYSPCTWPWIDLYLNMRSNLPSKKRLSIEFFNQNGPAGRSGYDGSI